MEDYFSTVEIDHDPTQWQLFIDSSTKNPKSSVISQWQYISINSISFAYLLLIKEDYEIVKQLLIIINCAKFKW